MTELRYDTISFLSDYGHRDEFVGVVHSVIRSMVPDVAVIDVTHEIPRHDVRAGGLALARSAQYLCPGVVVAVVDPGVGTQRRGIAIEVGDGESVLVGPDNGLLAPAVAMVGGASRAVSLTNTDYHLPAPGPTFDGRDVFAPVAAALCSGTPIDELGEVIDPAGLTPGILPVARDEDDALVAEVMWTDVFGNAQLNVDPDDIAGWGDVVRIRIGTGTPGTTEHPDWRPAHRVHTFAEVGSGQIGLIVDSYGLLTIALDRRSAQDELGATTGTEVTLSRMPEGATGSTGVTTPVSLGERRTPSGEGY